MNTNANGNANANANTTGRTAKRRRMSTDNVSDPPSSAVSPETLFPLVGIVYSLPKQSETIVPADVLLVQGTCIINEVILSGESTPLLKESIQLLDSKDKLDIDGAHQTEDMLKVATLPDVQRDTKVGLEHGWDRVNVN
ncbi:hypothetical protein K503DRAFT_785158 [Rhizopogon vinicolor AM-OR11-026]|uniref:P-type ATPase A domain-containing protein n=1 Tax=Rhizopogon vinicolor AM-OR11-026 TaxID=1314800 RepID=A0A1B7MRS9_9AGAM|nr:hypothetical protein K503DRAFT_785158 [Rhizopogon vinicolor AM-OR11-026]